MAGLHDCEPMNEGSNICVWCRMLIADAGSKPAIGSFRGKPVDENMSKAELLEVIKYLVKQSQADRKAADRMQKFMEEKLL